MIPRWPEMSQPRKYFSGFKAARLYIFSFVLGCLIYADRLDAQEFFAKFHGLILMLTIFVTVILTVETSFRVAGAMAKEFRDGDIERELHAFKSQGEIVDGLAQAGYASSLSEIGAYTLFAGLLYGWRALAGPETCPWKFLFVYFPIYFFVSARIIVSASYLFLGLGIRDVAPVDRLVSFTVLICYTALSLSLPAALTWLREDSSPAILGYLFVLTVHCVIWKPIGRKLALRALASSPSLRS